MMINNKPKQPFPDPDNFRDIRAWAKEVTQHFQRDSVTGLLQKDPLLLQHQVDSQLSRATVDGVLMFDPNRRSPVVSISGVWQGILAGNIGAIEVGIVDVVDGEGTVTFSRELPEQPLVLVTPEAAPEDDTTYSATAYGITTAGFNVSLRIVDTAYGTPVRVASGPVSWMAFIPHNS